MAEVSLKQCHRASWDQRLTVSWAQYMKGGTQQSALAAIFSLIQNNFSLPLGQSDVYIMCFHIVIFIFVELACAE